LARQLQKQEVSFQRQLSVPVVFDGFEVGCHRLDFLIQDLIVVELKAVKNLEAIHFATVRSYLRAVDKEFGLLLNFAKVTLEIKRVRALEWR
jgi:GxxExxY protein